MASFVVAVPREDGPGERRVALAPEQARSLSTAGFEVLVEPGAGRAAGFADDAYAAAGGQLTPRSRLCDRADVLLGVGRPSGDLDLCLRPGLAVVGLLGAQADPSYRAQLAALGVTALDLAGLPRTLSRAQEMDALTSQANVAGYKAALVAANTYGGFFPMLVTAAGTARPARVLVLGAGVAGLQAIGTARRLGALVSAHDIRPESRAEIESVGATFLDLGMPVDAEGGGGYARSLETGAQEAQRAALAARLPRFDVVITTAQVPGRTPPLLVDEQALKGLAPGAVVVDLASGPNGGNVANSVAGETVVTPEGVTILGADNLPATVPTAASAAYSRNVAALLRHLVRDGVLCLDPDDEIVAGILVAPAEVRP
jgi:H+-translocating NAD(P) transhydrogenase subunit alpha